MSYPSYDQLDQAKTINSLVAEVHNNNKKWWINIHTGEPLDRNVGELLCLIHSELSEAMEGHRKGLMDDHLPHRSMEEVEIADAFIRLLDYAGGRKLDLGGAYVEKMKYNQSRKDHQVEARLAQGGKAY
jgi:hypothetical protein